MQLQAFFAILRRWFGRERALARCPVRSRTGLAIVFSTLAIVRFASASVLVSGDVTPADDPFTTAINEGLPSDGNFINPFEAANQQTFFEGRHSDGADNISGTTDDTNVNIPEIVVGRSSFGTLLISGESALRDQDLTIGGSGLRSANSTTVRPGTGVMRITGFGSLFNNDPSIIPPGLPTNFQSKVPRAANGVTGTGNDLYVGRAGTVTTPASGTAIVGGTGTLEITAGARAEIQDAVVIGRDTGSLGTIIVDGIDSYLGSGGFEASAVTGEIHQMIVGQLGVGYLTITTGGTVRSDATPASAGSTNIGPIGAVIGSVPFSFTQGQQPDPGGVGTVTVDGVNSKWTVSGSLQIGGFDIGLQGMTIGDPEGDNLQYGSQAGRGTLYVQNGAIVNVVNALGADSQDPRLLLAIGRFGRIQMTGGLLNVGGVTGQNDNEARADSVQLINDGIISGTGRIETGVFNNRYLGEVRVNAGQTLVIDSSSDFTTGNSQFPLTNYGVMQVIGTKDSRAELEFDRAPSTTLDPIQPFRNLRVPRPTGAPLGDFYGGLISAQHATLRFRSGLLNSGMMAFTAGDNYVTGNVVNLAAPVASPTDPGIVTISGPNTKVTFEEDFINAGTLNISGGAVLEVLARHSFVTAGDLKITLNPQNSNQIFSAGDAGITGKLTVSLSGFAPGSIQLGDSFKILEVTGALGGVDFADPNYPKVDLTKSPLFTQLVLPSLVPYGLPSTAHLIPVYTTNSILLSVQSVANSVGPDFNGDGIVDINDLFVWFDNVGITSGATALQGDADGDGDVDGADFLFWQRNVGKSPPWTGAGSGAGAALGAAVPEPTSLVLVIMGSAFALPIRRRRAAR